MPKPFGKPLRRNLGLTRWMRITVGLWAAALPAFLLCGFLSAGYPTLAPRPFFWPSVVLFGLFYAFSIASWLRRRPSPRGPWESTRTTLFLSRFALGLLIAAPAGFLSGYLYGPMLQTANGLLSIGSAGTEVAIVEREGGEFVLDSPYWEPGFRWRIPHARLLPPDLAPRSVATVSFKRGLLGARFVDKIDYAVLR
jgi:hypothetical protein